MSDITVNDLTAQVARVAALRRQQKEIANAKALIEEQLAEAEGIMLALLESAELPNFRCELGLVSRSHHTSVRVPKTPEAKAAFFDYLKQAGMYDSMITVNSQTLNSFYKEEFEKARKEGREDFTIPGIDGETITPVLMFKQA